MRKLSSLHGIIEIDRVEEPPSGVYALLNQGKGTLDLELFVQVSVLSEHLQNAIRHELSQAKHDPKLSAETQAELDELKRSRSEV